jgi:hypothetical protein
VPDVLHRVALAQIVFEIVACVTFEYRAPDVWVGRIRAVAPASASATPNRGATAATVTIKARRLSRERITGRSHAALTSVESAP